jgi:LPXTG-site transpeptidase (sortase) family protein
MPRTAQARRGRGRLVAVLILASSVLVILGTGMVLWQDTIRLPSIGDRSAALQAEQVSAATAGSQAGDSGQAGDSSEISDAVLERRLGTPVRVRVDALRIDAPVIPVGLVEGDVLEVPEDIDEVGWYEFGPKPGSRAGSSVLVAHRDGTTQGRGVFFSLDALDVDSTVEVETSTGFRLRYQVVAVEGIRKREFEADIEEFFAVDGPPRLTLITCGGAFDQDSGGYQANVVVTAVPVPS